MAGGMQHAPEAQEYHEQLMEQRRKHTADKDASPKHALMQHAGGLPTGRLDIGSGGPPPEVMAAARAKRAAERAAEEEADAASRAAAEDGAAETLERVALPGLARDPASKEPGHADPASDTFTKEADDGCQRAGDDAGKKPAAKPATASDAFAKPATASDAFQKPATASDAFQKPATASDAFQKPATASDAFAKPATASDASAKPATASDAFQKPATASDAFQKPATEKATDRFSRQPPSGVDALKKPAGGRPAFDSHEKTSGSPKSADQQLADARDHWRDERGGMSRQRSTPAAPGKDDSLAPPGSPLRRGGIGKLDTSAWERGQDNDKPPPRRGFATGAKPAAETFARPAGAQPAAGTFTCAGGDPAEKGPSPRKPGSGSFAKTAAVFGGRVGDDSCGRAAAGGGAPAGAGADSFAKPAAPGDGMSRPATGSVDTSGRPGFDSFAKEAQRGAPGKLDVSRLPWGDTALKAPPDDAAARKGDAGGPAEGDGGEPKRGAFYSPRPGKPRAGKLDTSQWERGAQDDGRPFSGEKFPDAGAAPCDDGMVRGWQESPAPAQKQLLTKTVEHWLRKHGPQQGLQAEWAKTFTLKTTTTDAARCRWTVAIDDGKAPEGGPGKDFVARLVCQFDTADGTWSVARDFFEVRPKGKRRPGGLAPIADEPKQFQRSTSAPASPIVPQKMGRTDADEAARLREARGVCAPPCVFVANMFDKRFCRECLRYAPGMESKAPNTLA